MLISLNYSDCKGVLSNLKLKICLRLDKIMKIKYTLLLTIFILLISCSGTAQVKEDFEKLIVNKWSLDSFEVEGQVFPPRERNKHDSMVFYADKTVESISKDKVQTGSWVYDQTSGIIKIVDHKNQINMQIKLINITTSTCILEIENPEGTYVKLHMISVTK